MNNTVLIFDPIAMDGGSKKVTRTIIDENSNDLSRVDVLTGDANSWLTVTDQPYRLRGVHCMFELRQGIGYVMKHLLFSAQILWKLITTPSINVVWGCANPSIDFAIYLARRFRKFRLIQFVHGPVANSRLVAKSLSLADEIHCLSSALPSLQKLVNIHDVQMSKVFVFTNGLSTQHWPTPSRQTDFKIMWASSLIGWKRLDTFIKALELFGEDTPNTAICYLPTKDKGLSAQSPPKANIRVQIYEHPENLDEIRSSCSVFVSTSEKEPFGLAILEAMAAGLCVVIPKDGAYWDVNLVHGSSCVKYRPNDPSSLKEVLETLRQSPKLTKKIGDKAKEIALDYQADKAYKKIKF